jgi:serine/threonine kinase PknH
MRQHIALAIAATCIAGCSSGNHGGAGEQAGGTTTTTGNAPMVAPERLVSLLPTAAEANTIFGVSDMVFSDPQNQFDTNTIRVSNPDCASAVGPLAASVYRDSGNTGLSWTMIFEQDAEPGARVTAGAVSLPSADAAKAFLQGLAAKWKACSGQTIVDANALSEQQHALSDFSGTDSKIELTSTPVQSAAPPPPVAIGGGQEAQALPEAPCQRVLSTISNVVLDILACAPQLRDQGSRVEDLMAARVTQPGP